MELKEFKKLNFCDQNEIFWENEELIKRKGDHWYYKLFDFYAIAYSPDEPTTERHDHEYMNKKEFLLRYGN